MKYEVSSKICRNLGHSLKNLIIPSGLKTKMPKLYVLILIILAQRMVSSAKKDNNYSVGIPINFLQGVENCDIQILYDVIHSNYFAFLYDSLLPRTILFTKIYKIQNVSRIENSILNIFKSRPSYYKISIWISKRLSHTEEKHGFDGSAKFTGWLEVCTSFHYGFRCDTCEHNKMYGYNWNFLGSTKNVYPIVPTNMKLVEVLTTLGIYDNRPENFMVAIISEGKREAFAKLCIKRNGLEIKKAGNYKCFNKNKDNISFHLHISFTFIYTCK